MSVNPKRVKILSQTQYDGGTVVYQMCRELRADDNEALLFAQELARKHKAKLIVNYVIWNYGWTGATRRFYEYVITSLQEVERVLREHNIPLVVTFENQKLFKQKEHQDIPSHIGAVIIDQLPLRFMKKWKQLFLERHPSVPLYEVDAHNCIPVWETSLKQEFAAHTIRRKIHEKLPSFLEEFDILLHHTENGDISELSPLIDWNDVAKKIVCNENVALPPACSPGEDCGKKLLSNFLNNKLENYETSRNEINNDGQSNLSPYLAHGNISRRRVLLETLKQSKLQIEDVVDVVKNGSNGEMGSTASFVEELVVRAEIAENFCFYNDKYDSFDGFPSWSKETLVRASTDAREYIYSLKEFEGAMTHDDLWNAAQMQMVTTGKMHGYMRMYWAKKILEWSVSPKEAMRIAVYLNDMYELDGRDPNGYVGCAWSVGGVHDRPWFKRPIFGAIRYMAESGVAKRGKIKLYIEKWIPSQGRLIS